MRKPIIAGNWKMNKTPEEAKELVTALVPLVKNAKCDVVICPPFVDLCAVKPIIAGTNIHLGVQNIHWAEKGAFTGEISADMLKAHGVEYAIVGHSERRQYFGETDATVNQRAKAAIAAGITPIICVGESLEQRESGVTNAVVSGQTKAALDGIEAKDVETLVIAYEPIWAIGTGKTATKEDANATIAVIRGAIAEVYGKDVAEKVRIQYGGSMNPKNASELMSMPEIDGGLIGGASLKAEDFSKVVNY
ncbi:triosephosphate isomerase [Clostridium sp. CAG:1024]|jgi:triosephosphate isomerase|nr:triosephosphate isomerase [Clostridium sp. CAG:1024]